MSSTGEEAPAASVPDQAAVSVRTTDDPARTVSVTPCEPDPEAADPWLRRTTEKVTVLPAAGFPGDQVTAEATRSELLTGVTTRFVEFALLDSFVSTMTPGSSTTARTA
jgi:hypothetical protein